MVASRTAVLRWEPLPARMQRRKPPKAERLGKGSLLTCHRQAGGRGTGEPWERTGTRAAGQWAVHVGEAWPASVLPCRMPSVLIVRVVSRFSRVRVSSAD